MTKRRLDELRQEWAEYKRRFLAGDAPNQWPEAELLLEVVNK